MRDRIKTEANNLALGRLSNLEFDWKYGISGLPYILRFFFNKVINTPFVCGNT